jgi:PKD repeat protein
MQLAVQDARGAWSETAMLPITIEPGPNNPAFVAILPDARIGTAPFTVTFNSLTDDPDGDHIVFYSWRIEADGREPEVIEGESLSVFTHTFTEPGIYTVHLTVRDERGLASDAAAVLVYVDP